MREKIYLDCKKRVDDILSETGKNQAVFFWEVINQCKKEGLTEKDVEKFMIPEISQEHRHEIVPFITAVYHGSLKRRQSNFERIEEFMKKKYEFRFNEVLDQTEHKAIGDEKFTRIDSYDQNSIFRRLKREGIPVHPTIIPSILHSSFALKYHPFKAYFQSLPEWDGKDYISELASTVKTDDEKLWLSSFKKWIVAAVASAMEDDVVNHTLIVLSGAQGKGKTTWMNRLVPEPLKEYFYSGAIDPKNKDTLVHMSECFLIYLDELETLNRTGIGELKQIITLPRIRIRKPYDRNPIPLVRRASFMGAVNTAQFLNDSTGNRRFLAFEISEINYQHTIDINVV